MDLTEVLLTLNLIFINLWGSRFFCNSTLHQWLLNLSHVSLSFCHAAPWRQKLGTPSQILHLSTESLYCRLCETVGLLPRLYTGKATSKISWFSTSPSTSTKLPASRNLEIFKVTSPTTTLYAEYNHQPNTHNTFIWCAVLNCQPQSQRKPRRSYAALA